MTRNEYEDIEGYATAAMIGLLAGGNKQSAQDLSVCAFNVAKAFQAEKLKRLGEKPGYEG